MAITARGLAESMNLDGNSYLARDIINTSDALTSAVARLMSLATKSVNSVDLLKRVVASDSLASLSAIRLQYPTFVIGILNGNQILSNLIFISLICSLGDELWFEPVFLRPYWWLDWAGRTASWSNCSLDTYFSISFFNVRWSSGYITR